MSLPKLEKLSTQQQPSAAQKLKQYRQQYQVPAHLEEHLLLKDMIYLLQGIDGRYVYFKTNYHNTGHDQEQDQEQEQEQDESWEEGGIGFHEPNTAQRITPPMRDLILKLTELGWLYKKIQAFTNHPDNNLGTVQQAFTFALKEELGTYYRAIAIIESHLSNNTNNNNNNNNTGLMTSKALLLHLNPTVLRLRMSAALISATKGMHGGQMISVLHSYTDHGDPVVHLFTCNLLEKVSVPWFATLVSWMWDGLLVDPLDEFFIANARNLPNLSSSSSSSSHHHQNNNHNPPDFDNGLPADAWNVWQTKFSFRKHMVPSFISEGFARKIFSTGKSLNFIRHSCGDYEWHQTRSRIYKASRKESLHYKDMAGLQQTISSTYGIATQQLFHIFFVKLSLLDHLKAVKDYLLLGRGDFVSLLISSLGPSLNKPAHTLYRHNLTATLEAAIRATSPDRQLLHRLDVRMLDAAPHEAGWDVFMLEYKPDKPIDLLLSPHAMEKYMRMFRILWKLKRLQYALDRAWKLVILGVTRGLQHLHFLRDDFHHARLVISEMIHFTRQLQAYCHLEVIDCGWQELEKKLTSEGGDLDSLIDAHNAYLDRLVSKGLLLSSRVGKENTCLVLAEECFKVILAFKSSIDNLYAFAQAESARIQSGVQKSSGRRAGKYGRMDSSDDDDDEGYVEDNGGSSDDEEGGQDGGRSTSDEGSLADRSSAMRLEGLRAQLAGHSRRFTELVLDLISSLSTQQDSDMKFLAVRLNFSLFYMRTSKASSSAAATAATTTTTTATTTTTTTTTTALSAPRPLPRSASSTRLPSASAAAAVARSTLTHHKLPASFSSASAAAAHNKRFTQ